MKFGSTLASAFTVNSDTQITATVPAGAGTGAIAVTTPTLGTLTSSTDFVVNHARNASIALSGKKATGDVTATDGFTKCAATVPVNIQHLKKGKWKTVAGVLTKADGSYKAVGLTERRQVPSRRQEDHAFVGRRLLEGRFPGREEVAATQGSQDHVAVRATIAG